MHATQFYPFYFIYKEKLGNAARKVVMLYLCLPLPLPHYGGSQ